MCIFRLIPGPLYYIPGVERSILRSPALLAQLARKQVVSRDDVHTVGPTCWAWWEIARRLSRPVLYSPSLPLRVNLLLPLTRATRVQRVLADL